ncbi:nucleotide exchange factor GrpE [Lachnospiraceae bacterium 38-10]
MAEKEKDILEEVKETDGAEEMPEEGAEKIPEENGEEEAPDGEKDPEGEAPAREKEKKGFRKKSREDKKTDALNEKIGELEDKVKRQLAEFENFRNRTEKEKLAMFEVGAKSVIEKMLPVVDNFERGLSGLSEEEKEAPFASGMQMVYKQLLTELDSLGVKPIEAVGKEFDPNLHNAVMQVESEEYGSGTVAQEMMKGYTYRDSVVRHSMVAVVS